MLQIGEATCRYAASQLLNGLGPDEARETAVFVAGELELVAEALRRLTRLGPAERRERAVQLAGLGWSKPRVAVQFGVSAIARCCGADLRSRPRPPGDSTAGDS